MIALTALMTLAAYLLDGPLWGRLALVFLAVPLAILGNIMRVASLLFIASAWGADAAFVFYHDYSGPGFFVVVLALMLPITRLVQCRESACRGNLELGLLSRDKTNWVKRFRHSYSMKPSSRSLIVAILLIAGLLIVYGPQISPILLGQSQQPADELTYLADLDFWQRTNRETTVTATARFDLDSDLFDIPLAVGDWQGEEVPQTNEEVMILLDPEQYVQRLYHNSRGEYLWLSLIGGRSSQPFHAPDICYDADGWQYNLSSSAVALDGGGDTSRPVDGGGKALSRRGGACRTYCVLFLSLPKPRPRT